MLFLMLKLFLHFFSWQRRAFQLVAFIACMAYIAEIANIAYIAFITYIAYTAGLSVFLWMIASLSRFQTDLYSSKHQSTGSK